MSGKGHMTEEGRMTADMPACVRTRTGRPYTCTASSLDARSPIKQMSGTGFVGRTAERGKIRGIQVLLYWQGGITIRS